MDADAARLTVGQVLADRYWLQEHLGRGAMGDVFRAQHVKVARPFAIKLLHPHLLADPKTCARFDREAELAGRLRHRNVVSVLDLGATARTRYLVMELAEGPTLARLLEQGPMERARVIHLAMQICDGLQHAHERQVLHRDLKPENIIIEGAGGPGAETPRIVDFGLAILREGALRDDDRLTTSGVVLGTPHYLAPEAATARPLDHRIDLFALGIILFEMLTGRLPFDGDAVDVAIANVRTPTPLMRLRAPGVTVDPLLEALTARLMAKDPDDRPASARDVRDVLALIATDREAAARVLCLEPRLPPAAPADTSPDGDDTPIPPRLETPTRELLRLARRRSRSVVGASVLALGLGLIGLSTLVRGERGEIPARASTAPRTEAAAPRPGAGELAGVPSSAGTPIPVREIPLAVAGHRALRASLPRAVNGPSPDAPAEPLETARAAPLPPPAAERSPDEVGATSTEAVLALYASLARELKTIADRRDLSADDLWRRYRQIRIQDAIETSAKRAEAMHVLAEIDRELQRRDRPGAGDAR